MDERLDRNVEKYRKKKEKRIKKKLQKEQKRIEKEKEVDLVAEESENQGNDAQVEKETSGIEDVEQEEGILSKRIKEHESYVSVMCDISNEDKDSIVKKNIKTQDKKYAIPEKSSSIGEN